VGARRSGYALLFTAMLYALIVLTAVILPIIMSLAETPYFHGDKFVYFGLCGGIALAIIAAFELRKRKGADFYALLPSLTFFFVCFYYLIFVTECWARSWDYLVYEGAAIAVLQGKELYASGYLYPPFTAQLLEKVYLLSEAIAAHLPLERDWTFCWDITFYLYQCGQYFATLLCFSLCYKFARRAGLNLKTGLVVVAALFLLNDPLLRTLRFNQVNLWVLDLILLSILTVDRYPAPSGVAVAVAAHIKVFPLIILLPWAAIKKRAEVLWAAVGFLGIVFVQTNWGTNWKWWAQFIAFVPSFPRHLHLRNTSLYNLVYHSAQLIGRLFNWDAAHLDYAVDSAVVIVTVGFVMWFVLRFIKREKLLSGSFRNAEPRDHVPDRQTVRLFSHTVDALTLVLLISPMAWEHQYVLTLPIIIWAFATRGNDRPWQIGVAAFLILALPTFDVFILSYHRFVGLLILAVYTSPLRLRYEPSGKFGVLAPAPRLI
jgi:hypothetical protein